jgi:Phospholipase_D-nuclease N-terminal/Short C-terminal domain
MVATTFWESFFLILLFLPLAMIWAFTLLDIFRRDDMAGGSKALWVACVILVPFLGTLVYLVSRPSEATTRERVAPDIVSHGVAELAKLAELHDRGKLTDSEFAAEKARVLGAETVPA